MHSVNAHVSYKYNISQSILYKWKFCISTKNPTYHSNMKCFDLLHSNGKKLGAAQLVGVASQPSNFPASNIQNGTGSHKNQIFTMEPKNRPWQDQESQSRDIPMQDCTRQVCLSQIVIWICFCISICQTQPNSRIPGTGGIGAQVLNIWKQV